MTKERMDCRVKPGNDAFGSIRLRLAYLLAGRHQIEALLDLAERERKARALLRGETGHDLALLPEQPRDQLLIQRAALAGQAQGELAAVVCILHALDQLAPQQRSNGPA